MARLKCTFKWQDCTFKWQGKSEHLDEKTKVYV